jgi:translocation and assembly module TamB
LSEPPTLEETVHEVAETAVKVARGRTLPKILLTILVIIGLLLTAGLLGARFGVLLPQGRMLIEASANGLKLGRLGKLKVEGLEGDIWRDFGIRTLTISDEKGVWLEAKNVAVSWRYMQLFSRTLHIDKVSAKQLTVLRRPTLTPKEKSGALPVSVFIDELAARVELLPAFSYRRGLYDVTGRFAIKRGGGGPVAQASVASLLHAGDHLNLSLDLSKGHPLAVHANVVEAQGGALAGAIGLPSNLPFGLQADIGGQMSVGKIKVLATSGGAQPVTVDGAWTPQGGQARGRVSLTASTLTRTFAERLGPEANFTITGRKAPASLFDLQARVVTANLTVTAQGRGDLGKRTLGPDGVALSAASAVLSKLTGGPEMGPAQITGRLKGTAQDWRFAGDAQASKLTIGDYQLDRVSGPVALSRRKGQFDLKGQAAGVGGKGSGLAAALLGGKPTASFEASRLADGRLALKDLDATGAGLKVQASGGRSLLGGLTFKGKGDFSNLAAARPGANGGLSATWSAVQAGPGKPWTLGVDAQGAKLASGYAELDRLLGASPRLKAQANVGGGEISVSEASLDGAALHATSAGVRGADGSLKFKLDWSADGPFRAGPVEITGKAKGSGAITGTLAAPRADLLADFEAIDVPRLPLKTAHLVLSFLKAPDGSSGAVTLTAASAYGPATAHSAFRFPGDGVDLTDLGVDAGGLKASGGVALRSRGASRADLKLALTKGAFLEAGEAAGSVRVVDQAGGAQAHLDLSAKNAVLPGRALVIGAGRITADGSIDDLPYAVQANGATNGGRWKVAGQGRFAKADAGWRLGFDGGGRYGRRDLKTTETAVFRFGGPELSARMRLAATGDGLVSVDGRIADGATQIKAQVQHVGVELFDQDLTGLIDGTLVVEGQGAQLSGRLDTVLDGVRGRGSDAAQGLNGVLKARLAGDELALDGTLTNSQGLTARANLVLPAEASARPFRMALNRRKPIKGTVFADGEVKPLWDLLVGGERELAGRVKLQGTLGGTLADIRAVGEASVEGGRFADGSTGLVLRDVNLKAGLADNAINISQATGADGHGGTVTGLGRISLLREGASTFRLDLKGFRLIDNDLATASASGQATLDRNADGKVRLSGALTIDRADVSARTPTPTGVVAMDVVEVNRPVDLGGGLAAPVNRGGTGIALDVSLKAPRRIFLRGKGLDVELSLDAHVGGTTSSPNLSGAARVVRGEYDFAGKRFEFDERGVVYLATSPNNIRLDLSATRDDPSLTAVVRIRGTAAKPEITLTSTPTLPNDEVLSQVLFGRSASQLSPLEAAQLASALSSLARGGGFDVIGNLKTLAGLDRLALGGGGESGVTVSGGKYLTDDVYLELTGGGRDGAAAQVEWRVGRSLSIISKVAGQGDGKLAVRWRKDY